LYQRIANKKLKAYISKEIFIRKINTYLKQRYTIKVGLKRGLAEKI
jgi:hypothetical protein